MPVAQQLVGICNAHCWSPGCDRLALCANGSTVLIYGVDSWHTPWQRVATLDAHRSRVMDVDWSTRSGRIVTCGMDRCCYVWQETVPDRWEPSLVRLDARLTQLREQASDAHCILWIVTHLPQQAVMQLQLPALCIRWSPDGAVFALGSSDKSIGVGVLDQGKTWVVKLVSICIVSLLAARAADTGQ